MEKIKLTRKEKKVLRIVKDCEHCPSTFSLDVFSSCCLSLEAKGLVKCVWSVGHVLEAVRLTEYGESYLLMNPRLSNPVNWLLIVAALSLIVSITALFVSCNRKF